jgi:hypothetical protein
MPITNAPTSSVPGPNAEAHKARRRVRRGVVVPQTGSPALAGKSHAQAKSEDHQGEEDRK